MKKDQLGTKFQELKEEQKSKMTKWAKHQKGSHEPLEHFLT
jgi:hypothetical protein